MLYTGSLGEIDEEYREPFVRAELGGYNRPGRAKYALKGPRVTVSVREQDSNLVGARYLVQVLHSQGATVFIWAFPLN
jgi:hypothetical protein